MRIWSTEEQALQLVTIAMIVETGCLIRREQRVKVLVSKDMRVASCVAEHHEISHAQDSKAKGWCESTKQSCCLDDFGRQLGTNTNNGIRIKTAVQTRKVPDQGTRTAVGIGFLCGQEECLRLL